MPDLAQLLRDAAKEIAEMAENLAEAYAPTWPAPAHATVGRWDEDDDVHGDGLTLIADVLYDEDGREADGEREVCREEGCDNPLDDGEGWDGRCGTCADRREAGA